MHEQKYYDSFGRILKVGKGKRVLDFQVALEYRNMGLLDVKNRGKPESGNGMGTVLLTFLVICFVGTNLLALHAFSMSRDVANFVIGDRSRVNVMDTELMPKLVEQFNDIQVQLKATQQVSSISLDHM